MSEGYKMTELGEIPESWEVKKLNTVCDVRDGTHDSPKYVEDGIPFVTSKNLTDTKLNLSDVKYISQEDHILFSKRSHVENGDILFGMIGTVGKPVIVDEEFEISIKNVALLKFRDNTQLNNVYALNVLKSSVVEDQFKREANGGVLKFVALGNIRNLDFPLPPLPEQQKIAEILSTVDEKIEVIDAQTSQTTELKKGLMQRLLTKGIGHTQFKDSPLGEIPQSWEVDEFDNIGLEFIDGDRGANYPSQNDFSKEGYCLFLSAKNVTKDGFKFDECQFISEEKDNQLRKGKLNRDDIVITTRGSVGNVALYDEHVAFENVRLNSGMVILRDPKDLFDKRFLFQLLKSPLFKKQMDNITFGSAQPQLTIKELKKMNAIIVPRSEQIILAEGLTTIDEKLIALQEKKNHYQELKKGLMQQLLTGKIRVNQAN